MRIAVDARSLMDDATGIGRVTAQLTTSLRALGHAVVAYACGGERPSAALRALVDGGVELVRHPLPMRAMRGLWLHDRGPRLEELVGRVDLCVATETMVPRTRAPVLAVVHDTLAIDHPEWFNPYGRRAAPENLARAFARARAIVTVSETVRAQLERHPLRAVPGTVPIHVVTPSVEPAARRTEGDGDYVLFCGTREPRKGIGLIAEALLWSRLHDVRLVVVGKPGWGHLPGQAALDRLRALGRAEVRGYVSERALAELREHAVLAVVPSLDEGFGLPLAEAMAAGCPAIASDIPVFREVGRDGARYADPRDALAWSAALEALCGDRAARLQLAERGPAVARRFSADAQAEQLARAVAEATS